MLPTLVNVNPSMNRALPDLREIASILGNTGEVLATPTLGALEDAAKQVAHAAPPVVAVWGGDGTIGGTLSALYRAYGDRKLPDLCFLPGGTMNCIARCLGARGTPGSMLARLVNALVTGRQMHRVERTPLRVGHRYGFLFGYGLIPNFLSFYDAGAHQGPLRALQVFAMTVPGLLRPRGGHDPFFDPFMARITIQGETWEGSWTSISAGGVPCLPLGFRAYTRAHETAGQFHFVAHDLRAWGAAYELVTIKLGLGMQRVKQGVTDRVLVETERKMAFNLDGDNHEELDRFELMAGARVGALLP